MIIIISIRKYERQPLTKYKRSACWNVHESSGRCIVHEQND